MKTPYSRPAALALVAAVSFLFPAGPALADADDDRIDVLAEEIQRLKEHLAIPETDRELQGWGGLGPAASKVYYSSPGLSLGGYGEFYYQTPTRSDGSTATGDYYRFVAYIGYKFNPWLLMNTEIEYEHATTSKNWEGKAGSVSVEFSYLDFLLSEGANIRAGSLLIPVGIVNKMHEPPFYRGSFRPAVETILIPSTWRELGAGLHGALAQRFSYELYVVNGLNAMEFDTKGIRGGRQKGNRVLFEDVGGVAAVTWSATGALSVSGSGYVGNSGQGQTFDGVKASVRTVVAEAHIQYRHRGFDLRALVATTRIGDADLLSAELGEVIPESQLGWYGEAAYDIGPMIGLPVTQAMLPWIRYETFDLHAGVPDGASANPGFNAQTITVGLEYKPTLNVVIKTDWTWQDTQAGVITANPFRLGAGFIF